MLKLRGPADDAVLAPIYETIRLVKAELPPAVTFLGFCGGPWTVATYMVAGRGTPDQAPARLFAYRHPEAFAHLIDVLVEASSDYLVRQLDAGVDAVQIFDTWAGILPPDEFRALVHCADQENRCRCAARGAGREDHRVSARRRQQSETLRRGYRNRCRRSGLDG